MAKPRVTIAEDLVLMLLDPANGRPVVTGTTLERAIGGALLLDLAVAGRLTADGDDAKALLVVRDPSPTGDPILDEALGRLAGPSLRARHAVERLARRMRDSLLDRLVERGAVVRSRLRLAKVFPVTVWQPTLDGPGPRLRGRLTAVLVDGQRPDPHLAAVIALIHALKVENRVVVGQRRQLRARAEEISMGDSSGGAGRAVRDVQASVAAAVAVAAAVGSSGAS